MNLYDKNKAVLLVTYRKKPDSFIVRHLFYCTGWHYTYMNICCTWELRNPHRRFYQRCVCAYTFLSLSPIHDHVHWVDQWMLCNVKRPLCVKVIFCLFLLCLDKMGEEHNPWWTARLSALLVVVCINSIQ